MVAVRERSSQAAEVVVASRRPVEVRMHLVAVADRTLASRLADETQRSAEAAWTLVFLC